PFFYGWVIVIISAITLFFSGPGQTYSISIFINAYIERFGWSRSLVSSIYSFASLCAGLLLPFIGRKLDSVGHRKMLTLISLLLGITCLWMSFVFNPVMLFIGFVFMRLLGQGSMTLIPSTLVSQWFVRRRGRAISIMTIGSIIGSATLPVINNWLLNLVGMRFTWIIWGISLMAIMAPLGWIFVRNRPEEMKLLPDGEDIRSNIIRKKESENNIMQGNIDWTLKDAMKTRTFWLMIFCMAVPAMVNTGLTFHMVSIIEEKGLSMAFAASILSLTAIIQLPLNFLAGHMVDRIKVHYIRTVNYWILAIAMFAMVSANSSKGVVLYAILVAIFNAFNSVTTEALWPSYYGRKHLGSIRSIATTAMVIGSALGPLPFGFAFDLFNGYKEIIFIMMIFPVMASLASLISPPPGKPS
ncbi:MFS transporter, partial [Clostridium sp.]|uniref:MFS transporter n=1 Tax=Clostridium sp. TaxID=1506 RepID=UPI001A613AA0